MSDSDEERQATERRVRVHLREVFVEAYEIVGTFFYPKNAWGGQTHEHLAFRALHERFPTLSGEEVLVIVLAAKQVFGSGRKPMP